MRGVREVQIFFESLGRDIEVHRFDDSTATADLAAQALGVEVARIVKSVVVVADGEPLVVLVGGDVNVDLKKVRKLLKAKKLRIAPREVVVGATGFEVGAVPPVAHARYIRVLMDSALLGHDLVYPAAGTKSAMFQIEPHALRDAALAEVADVGRPK